MATFTAIKNRGGGRGALGGVLRYTQQDEKTLWEGQRLVSGWNCTAQSARSEMQLTKERFRKTDGRQYYHFVQSFSEQDDLTPQKARTIALELAQREFPAASSTRVPRTCRPTGCPMMKSASPTICRSFHLRRSRSSRNEWAPGSIARLPRARAGSSG